MRKFISFKKTTLELLILIMLIGNYGCSPKIIANPTQTSAPTGTITPIATHFPIPTSTSSPTQTLIPTYTALRTTTPLKERIFSISVSPDGEILVLTDSHGIQMYRISSGEEVNSVRDAVTYIYQGIFSYIAWSPDGLSLAVSRPNNGIRIWNVADWKLLTDQSSLLERSREKPGFAWSPDGNRLALGRGNGEAMIWEKTQNQWQNLPFFEGDQVSITWTPNEYPLVLRTRPDYGFYNLQTGEMISKSHTPFDGGYAYAIWSPDGKYAYLFFDLGGEIYDIRENRFTGFKSCCYSAVAWSSDGQYFAAAPYGSGDITVWDLNIGKVVREETQGEDIFAFAWTPDNDLLAIGVLEGRQVLWNTNTGKILFPINE